MKVTEAIASFLQSQKGRHNNPALLDLYNPDMEVQVNVAASYIMDGKQHVGQRAPGKKSTYTDGVNEWWNIRVPRNAATEPEFNDYELHWPLELHAREIGLTGWNWKNQRSSWVGFDFDAITGHAVGVGTSAEKLVEIKDAVNEIDWIEVTRSTRGQGLHIRVYFSNPGISTSNHNEHAALARFALTKLSTLVGFDLTVNVDTCGSNIWIWSTRATPENHGYELLKPSTSTLGEGDLNGWRSHLDVVSRKRAKVRLDRIDDDSLESLGGQQPDSTLDEEHLRHINELTNMGVVCNWVQDHRLLQTHTHGLKRLHDRLNCKGLFETVSTGSDLETPNCFMYPREDGAWRVYRFGQGTTEADSWEQDGNSWTACWFNRAPDLSSSARAHGGIERENGGYYFESAEKAFSAAAAIGAKIEVPDSMLRRETILRETKNNRLIAEVAALPNDEGMDKWDAKAKKNYWTRLFPLPRKIQEKIPSDARVRRLISPTGEKICFMVYTTHNTWSREDQSGAKAALRALGYTKDQPDTQIGAAVLSPYTKVTLPFGPEYPSPYQWNLDAAKLRYRPADTDEPKHPTWDAIFEHLGGGLDDAVKHNEWCRENNILTGAEWLRLWFVSILRNPFCKLPYLFLWGPGNAGKSSAYEAFQLLVDGGVVDAKRAIKAQNDFNGELDGAVLAYIDEHDLSKDSVAAERVKEWCTAMNLSVRRMRTNLYHVPSALHFIHVANDPSYCEVLPGDVRKVIAYVGLPAKEIEKHELHERLKAEAPQFMRTVMDMRLPPPDGRMAIAVLDTSDKSDLIVENEPLAEFFVDHLVRDPDGKVVVADLQKIYHVWCENNGVSELEVSVLGRKLSQHWGIKKKKVQVSGNTVRYYLGVRFRNPSDDQAVVMAKPRLMSYGLCDPLHAKPRVMCYGNATSAQEETNQRDIKAAREWLQLCRKRKTLNHRHGSIVTLKYLIKAWAGFHIGEDAIQKAATDLEFRVEDDYVAISSDFPRYRSDGSIVRYLWSEPDVDAGRDI